MSNKGGPKPQAICDFSGFKVPLHHLVKNWDGMMVDRRFVDRRNPQDFVKGIPDKQALPFSRPEAPDNFIEGIIRPEDL